MNRVQSNHLTFVSREYNKNTETIKKLKLVFIKELVITNYALHCGIVNPFCKCTIQKKQPLSMRMKDDYLHKESFLFS